jgi:HSP20 family protein
MDRLKSEMERLYDRFFDLRPFRRFTDEGEWMPSVDFSETAKEIIVNAEIPGVEAKEIDVNLKGECPDHQGGKEKGVRREGGDFPQNRAKLWLLLPVSQASIGGGWRKNQGNL